MRFGSGTTLVWRRYWSGLRYRCTSAITPWAAALAASNVVVTNGLGPVPQPDEAQLRSPRTFAEIVDLATGGGLPVDRPDPVPD
jgi:hypothetical protein